MHTNSISLCTFCIIWRWWNSLIETGEKPFIRLNWMSGKFGRKTSGNETHAPSAIENWCGQLSGRIVKRPWMSLDALEAKDKYTKKLSTQKANCLPQNFWMNDQALSGLTTSHGDLLHNLFEDLWSGIPVRFNNCTYTSVRSPSLTSTLAMWNLQVVTNLCCSSHLQQHYCTCLASS